MPDSLTRRLPFRLLMTTDAVGGVWRYSLDLARGLAERPVLAVLGPAPSDGQREEAAGLGLRLIETGLPLDWTAENAAELGAVTAALQAISAREQVTSVHLHAPALAGSGRWRVPVVVVAHSCVATWWAAVRGGAPPMDFSWRTAATGAGMWAADAVIAPTWAHAEAVREIYGEIGVTVVHNGAAPSYPVVPGPGPGIQDAEGGLAARRTRGSSPRVTAREAVFRVAPAVLTAGRLWDEGKNVVALDRVAAGVGVPVRAAGPVTGPNGAAIDLPGLELLGALGPEGMRRAYADATVFASLARYEPFGLSVLEAARAGLRLVLSDIPSFRELWGGVARFVPVGDDPTPALRAALAERGDGGSAARAREFSLERMVAGTMAVHRRVRV